MATPNLAANVSSLLGETTLQVGNTTIHYDRENDVCSWLSQDFVEVISNKNPGVTFNNCLEWCSGCGFIGFRLLESGICNNITFLESSQRCIEDIEKTLNDPSNIHLKSKVSIVNSNTITDLINQKFDLIVGNPPLRNTTEGFQFWSALSNTYSVVHNSLNIPSNIPFDINLYFDKSILIDEDWEIHQDFFSNIKNNLNSNGVIYLLEDSDVSNVNTFSSFVSNGGLQITDTLTYNNLIKNPSYDSITEFFGEDFYPGEDNSHIYYLEIKSA